MISAVFDNSDVTQTHIYASECGVFSLRSACEASPFRIFLNSLLLLLLCPDQHVDIAALLIKYNTCVNATDKWAFTPLHEAAQKGRTQLCALLLAHGADPTMKNQEGQTPLDLATVRALPPPRPPPPRYSSISRFRCCCAADFMGSARRIISSLSWVQRESRRCQDDN